MRSLIQIAPSIGILFLYKHVATLGLLDAGPSSDGLILFHTLPSTLSDPFQLILPMLLQPLHHLLHLPEIVQPQHVLLPHPLLLHTLVCTISVQQILYHLLRLLLYITRIIILLEQFLFDVIKIIIEIVFFTFVFSPKVILIKVLVLGAVDLAGLALLPQLLPLHLQVGDILF
jgi:hypothetical protein